MDNASKIKIQQIINGFETGSAEGDYGNISVFNDGPNNIKQYTIGRSQTTEFGNLSKMLQMYVDLNGQYADAFKPYVNRIGKKPSIYKDVKFEKLVKDAEKDPIMHITQDRFFDEVYWKPAFEYFTKYGFATPLALLVIYDTAVHSGPNLEHSSSMMSVLRKRFSEKPPINGGNEKNWIKSYVDVRHDWLATHKSRPILRTTVYRTKTFKKLIAANNWNLTGDIRTENGVMIRGASYVTSSETLTPAIDTKAVSTSIWNTMINGIKSLFS